VSSVDRVGGYAAAHGMPGIVGQWLVGKIAISVPGGCPPATSRHVDRCDNNLMTQTLHDIGSE
jgi:hypothetical protein